VLLERSDAMDNDNAKVKVMTKMADDEAQRDAQSSPIFGAR
jgi:hypothetical protein